MAEPRFDGAVRDVRRWRHGYSLTVVVATDQVHHFVDILSNREHSSLCDVLSDNGISIDFRPGSDRRLEAEAGAGWIQLVCVRENEPSECHVLARNITRTQAREVAAGLTGQAPGACAADDELSRRGERDRPSLCVFHCRRPVTMSWISHTEPCGW